MMHALVGSRVYRAALIVLLFLAVACLIDPMVLFLLTCIPLFWIGGPAVFLALVSVLRSWSTSQRPRRAATNMLWAVFAFACFTGVAWPANHFVQTRAEAAGKAYPALA